MLYGTLTALALYIKDFNVRLDGAKIGLNAIFSLCRVSKYVVHLSNVLRIQSVHDILSVYVYYEAITWTFYFLGRISFDFV